MLKVHAVVKHHLQVTRFLHEIEKNNEQYSEDDKKHFNIRERKMVRKVQEYESDQKYKVKLFKRLAKVKK